MDKDTNDYVCIFVRAIYARALYSQFFKPTDAV